MKVLYPTGEFGFRKANPRQPLGSPGPAKWIGQQSVPFRQRLRAEGLVALGARWISHSPGHLDPVETLGQCLVVLEIEVVE